MTMCSRETVLAQSNQWQMFGEGSGATRRFVIVGGLVILATGGAGAPAVASGAMVVGGMIVAGGSIGGGHGNGGM